MNCNKRWWKNLKSQTVTPLKVYLPRNIFSGSVSMFLQIKGKKSEDSYQELMRSQKDRHIKTHGNCIEIFRLARPSFSIVPPFINSLVTLSLSCVHKHLLSFNWERRPCQSKYLDTVSVCLCVPVLLWSHQFLVRVFTFLSLNLSFLIVTYMKNFELFDIKLGFVVDIA